jgi:cytochrome c oxidase subunit I
MFTTGLGPIADSFFVAATMIIAVPTGIKIFNWLATMWGGSIQFNTAMLFCTGLLAVFTVGGLSGIMHAAAPITLQQHDSYFVVAHFHYVIVGGVMMGLWAGMYYWFPKVTGRLHERDPRQVALLDHDDRVQPDLLPDALLGALRDAAPDLHVLGRSERGHLQPTVDDRGVHLRVSSLIMIWNLVKSLKSGEQGGHNPWEASTLEWSIPSPPHHYNFPELPTVQSREPLWNDGERESILAVTMGEAGDGAPHAESLLLAHPARGAITLAWALVMTGIWWVILLGLVPSSSAP